MKRQIVILVTVITLIAMLAGVSVAMAAKPQKAIEMSNGMPSGEHETLLIHGKQAGYNCVECIPCDTCEPPVQCNVVNVPEYGKATIKYVSGRKVNIEELTVFDSCAGGEGQDPVLDDPAEVWLPYEKDGYWVFARALGKPAKNDEERYIILENESLEAYPLATNVSSPDEVILGLGMITQQGVFKADASGELHRFDENTSSKGKGKTQGVDITDMFLWSGLVFHPDLDINLDGLVDELDAIADNCTADINHDGTIDAGELATWESAHPDPDDVNGDGFVDAKDAIADTCYYDMDGDGEIYYDGDYEESTFPDCEFEEWLADNFVNFARARDVSGITENVKQFFEDMLRGLKTVFVE